MMPKKIVSQAIRNPSEFKRLFGGEGVGSPNLYLAAKSHPEYSDILIKMSYSDSENFRCVYPSLSSFHTMTKHFPNHAGDMIKAIESKMLNAFNDAGDFELLVKDISDLYFLIKLLPNFNVKITEFVIGNNDQLFRLVEQSNDIYHLAKVFPDRAEKQLLSSLNNRGAFERLINRCWSLCQADQLFPKFSDDLISVVLENPDDFNRIVSSVYDIRDVALAFPNYANKVIEKVIENEYSFKRVVKSPYCLDTIAGLFPSHEDKLINAVLMDPGHFRLIFETVDNLKEVSSRFPKYAYILDKSSVEEAAASAACYVKSLGEIKKSSFFMSYANKTKSTLFPKLPEVLQIKIAGLCGDPEVHDEEKSENIASDILGCQRY